MNISNLLQGLALLVWLGVLGSLGFVVFSAARGQRTGSALTLLLVLVGVAVLLTSTAAGIVIIEPNEIGVVINPLAPGALRSTPLPAGLHWVLPFIERVEHYSIARQTYTMSSVDTEGEVQGDDSIQARTADGQIVLIDASVIYSVDPAQAIQLHVNWGKRFEDEAVRPTARGAIRDAVAQFGVEQLVGEERAVLETEMTNQLAIALAQNNLLLVDFVLRNIQFSDEYAASVEQKQIAEQQAQQAALEADRVRTLAQGQADAAVTTAQGAADARIIQAKAEAEALTLIAGALKDNPDLLTYRYIERLAPNVQVMYLPSGQPYLIPLPTPPAVTTSTEVTTTVPVTP